jgi:hypothetical protein
MSAAYSAVPRVELPMATTTLNILQGLGGPIMTTLVTMMVESSLNARLHLTNGPFTLAFVLLSIVHLSLIAAAWRLPMWIGHHRDQHKEAQIQVFEALTD